MAFVPALIHGPGAFVPRGGMGAIPALLKRRAEDSGADIRCNARVTAVMTRSGRVSGVTIEGSDTIECDAVISNVHSIGTYEHLVEGIPASVRRRLRKLPLQSPGLCVYLSGHGQPSESYLRFMIDGSGVTLAVAPAPGHRTNRSDRFPIRLIKPIAHRDAERLGEAGQMAEIRKMVAQPWWQDGLSDFSIVGKRTPRLWGRDMSLYRDSMNPAMSRGLMLRGRMRHRSPWMRGLYLAGASTHPGQWVSFCAVSGILAAEAAHADFVSR